MTTVTGSLITAAAAAACGHMRRGLAARPRRPTRRARLLAPPPSPLPAASPDVLLAYRLLMCAWGLFIGIRQVLDKGRIVFVFFTGARCRSSVVGPLCGALSRAPPSVAPLRRSPTGPQPPRLSRCPPRPSPVPLQSGTGGS